MPNVTIYKTECNSSNLLEVQVGTNCPQGGDAGHGGRTLFRLTDRAGTAMTCRINDGEVVDASKIEIVFAGDSECETFTEALAFALAVLRSPRSEGVEETVD
jgi:hypothetical protein